MGAFWHRSLSCHKLRVVFLSVLIWAAASISLNASDTKQKTAAVTGLPLSPSFARIAFTLKQNIERLRHESTQPIVEGDFSTSPYGIHDKALTDEMERVKMFELKTEGDARLFAMLQSAQTFSMHDTGIRDSGIALSTRTLECLFDINRAIEERRYASDAACTYNNRVEQVMKAEDTAAEKERERQWAERSKPKKSALPLCDPSQPVNLCDLPKIPAPQ